MKFRAIEIPNKPYIVWEQWTGMPDALTVDEGDIPTNVSGICPLKIEGGSLVARTTGEMATAAAEYSSQMAMQAYASRVIALNADTFTYDSKQFPMFETARLMYEWMMREGSANYKVKSTTGDYDVTTSTYTAFLTAYKNKLSTYIM